MDDITFCLSDCQRTDCYRHPSNIQDRTIPHSYADFKGTQDCPEFATDINVPTNDSISRRAAIDTVRKYAHYDDFDVSVVEEDVAIIALKDLPSVQPEIIRCEECRWGREVCGNIECFVDSNLPPEYHGYEWFCPNGERRTDE